MRLLVGQKVQRPNNIPTSSHCHKLSHYNSFFHLLASLYQYFQTPPNSHLMKCVTEGLWILWKRAPLIEFDIKTTIVNSICFRQNEIDRIQQSVINKQSIGENLQYIAYRCIPGASDRTLTTVIHTKPSTMALHLPNVPRTENCFCISSRSLTNLQDDICHCDEISFKFNNHMT